MRPTRMQRRTTTTLTVVFAVRLFSASADASTRFRHTIASPRYLGPSSRELSAGEDGQGFTYQAGAIDVNSVGLMLCKDPAAEFTRHFFYHCPFCDHREDNLPLTSDQGYADGNSH